MSVLGVLTSPSSMPKADREQLIPEFLADRNAKFSGKALYDNLIEYKSITFSERTVKSLLSDLRDEGLVERRGIGNGYYKITEKVLRAIKED